MITTKEQVIKSRKKLFSLILDQFYNDVTIVDKTLGQAKFALKPSDVSRNEAEGSLLITITNTFFNREFTASYSIWQLGDMLRVGIKIEDKELSNYILTDVHKEIFHIWGNFVQPRVDLSRGTFFDWEFSVPKLYDSYLNQEKFIFGCRHMHLRLLRVIYDFCEKEYLNLNTDEKLLNILKVDKMDESLNINHIENNIDSREINKNLNDLNDLNDFRDLEEPQ